MGCPCSGSVGKPMAAAPETNSVCLQVCQATSSAMHAFLVLISIYTICTQPRWHLLCLCARGQSVVVDSGLSHAVIAHELLSLDVSVACPLVLSWHKAIEAARQAYCGRQPSAHLQTCRCSAGQITRLQEGSQWVSCRGVSHKRVQEGLPEAR